MLKKIIASAVGFGLVAGHTVAATAAPAFNADRAASPVSDAEQMEGLSEAWLIILFGLIAAGIIVLVENNEGDVDDLPASP